MQFHFAAETLQHHDSGEADSGSATRPLLLSAPLQFWWPSPPAAYCRMVEHAVEEGTKCYGCQGAQHDNRSGKIEHNCAHTADCSDRVHTKRSRKDRYFVEASTQVVSPHSFFVNCWRRCGFVAMKLTRPLAPSRCTAMITLNDSCGSSNWLVGVSRSLTSRNVGSVRSKSPKMPFSPNGFRSSASSVVPLPDVAVTFWVASASTTSPSPVKMRPLVCVSLRHGTAEPSKEHGRIVRSILPLETSFPAPTFNGTR